MIPMPMQLPAYSSIVYHAEPEPPRTSASAAPKTTRAKSIETAERPLPSGDLDNAASELRATLERFQTDRESLERSLVSLASPARAAKLKAFFAEWQGVVDGVDFRGLGQ